MSRRRGLRVGVDARSLLQKHPRGEGKTLLNLYRHIVEQQAGWQVVFFADEHAKQSNVALPPGVGVRSMTLPGQRYDSWENICLPLMALREHCDVLHCASSAGPYWSPVPTVLTVHDLIPLVADDGMDEALKRGFLRRLSNGLRTARVVIAVSNNTRRDILLKFPATKAKIEVVHWGATAHPRPVMAVSTPAAKTKPTDPYLIAFGGEAPRKNTAYVLERFIAIASLLPALQLVLAGVTGERERITVGARIAQAGLEQRLHMPGFVDEEELDAMMQGARALFYPSLYEGFGMPLLEAIERGVPVVASDRASIPEILCGVPGCLDLADTAAVDAALLRLVTDDAWRDDWVTRQRDVLQRFSWTEAARRTADLLRKAARG